MPPGKVVIQPDEHVFLEVGGCHRRYHTAMMRTVMLGNMPDSMYQAQETMKKALDAVHNIVQPGMTVSDVDNPCAILFPDTTCSGYSIGIAFPPSWDGYIVSLKQGDGTVFKEGMTST